MPLDSATTTIDVAKLREALRIFPSSGNVSVEIDDRGDLTISPPPCKTVTIHRSAT